MHPLMEHAIKNIWCSPRQDLPALLALTRITPKQGAFISIRVGWETLALPDSTNVYHIYQIGHNVPSSFGLSDVSGKWLRLSDVCSNELLLVDLYLDNGLQFPRSEAFMCSARNQNLLIAVRVQPKIAVLDEVQLYMRCYSNAYFTTKYSDVTKDEIAVVGGVIKTIPQLVGIQQKYLDYKAKTYGHTYAFHNGRFVEEFSPLTVVIGDVVEFVFDSSIYKVLDFKISDLDTFDSIKDGKGKYLIHQPKAGVKFIDYRDDLEMFIWKANASGRKIGSYYNRNAEDSVRMVTHADWSVPVDYVVSYANEASGWDSVVECTLRVHVRHGGYERGLVYEQHRIHELYKLTDAQIVQAMIGAHATVPEWQAAQLELSQYPTVMRTMYEDLTLEQVVNAYGYNSMSQICGDTPQRLENGRALLPLGLRENSTVYEYNASGELLGIVYHSSGDYYEPYNPNTALVEVIYGRGGRTLDAAITKQSIQIDPKAEYRFYRTPDGYPPGLRIWEDITGSDKYAVDNAGFVHWTYPEATYTYMVVSDNRFITYNLTLNYRDHLLKFSLQWRPDGFTDSVMEVPPGRIDLWLNGKALIEGLDYFVKFPQVVICNKEYLNQDDIFNQKITVRCTGFCDSEMRSESLVDFGYIKHQRLSLDDQFDIRDDKVVRIVIDGKLYHRDRLRFAEDNRSVAVPAAVREGAPYLVRDMVVPIQDVNQYQHLVLRKEAQEIDARVSSYMSNRLPEYQPTGVVAISRLYQLYSPFFAKVLWDIKNGLLVADTDFIADKTLLDKLESYEYLLTYEPCLQEIDANYVDIHPHDKTTTVEVTVNEYSFLSRVNKLYLKNRVSLTKFLTIKLGV